MVQIDFRMILRRSARNWLGRRRRRRSFLGILDSICRRSLVLYRRGWRCRTMEHSMIVPCVTLGRETSREDKECTRNSTDRTELRHSLVTDKQPFLILG